MIVDKDFLVFALVANLDYVKCENCRNHHCNDFECSKCLSSRWGLSYEGAEKLADIIINGIEEMNANGLAERSM